MQVTITKDNGGYTVKATATYGTQMILSPEEWHDINLMGTPEAVATFVGDALSHKFVNATKDEIARINERLAEAWAKEVQ